MAFIEIDRAALQLWSMEARKVVQVGRPTCLADERLELGNDATPQNLSDICDLRACNFLRTAVYWF